MPYGCNYQFEKNETAPKDDLVHIAHWNDGNGISYSTNYYYVCEGTSTNTKVNTTATATIKANTTAISKTKATTTATASTFTGS